jgi:hypothetical protein
VEPTTRIELVTSSLPRTRSYQLSYVGPSLERETGIEPATNSLEGCDSTTELLPPDVAHALVFSHYRAKSVLHPVERGGFEPP